MTESESIRRTLPWRIVIALIIICLLAVGGWAFAQDKPAALAIVCAR